MLKTFVIIAEPDLSKDDYSRLLALVAPEKQDRIRQYYFFRDARNSLIGDILIRTEICRHTGLRNDQLSFQTGKNGKPFLAESSHIHFNISHAGNYIACAIDDEPVGIDVELLNPVDMKIAHRFFSVDEKEYIISQPEEMRRNAFFEIWTKKESFIKRNGSGLSMPLASFSVLSILSGQEEPLYYHRVFEDKLSVCHVCSTKKEIAECDVMTVPEWIGKFDQLSLI